MNTMNPEELLSHADFVRLLARRLVFDENSAADIAQDTWLAAVEHPPASDRSPRAWLAQVVRNFSLKRYRTDSRRKARERTAGASARSPAPSAAEIAAREELRRRVVDAVQALDEPWRSTILLRYYDNLPHREVAARLGVPLETMRTRLKKGLALLRAKLAKDHDGTSDGWRLALAPLAGIDAAALSGGTASGVAGGVLAMAGLKAKVLFFAAALLVMGALVLVWSLLPGAEPDRGAATDPQPTAAVDAGRNDALPADRAGPDALVAAITGDDEPREKETLLPPSRDIVWKGTLIDYDGKPAQGVFIKPDLVKALHAADRPKGETTVESAGGGAFEIAGLVPGEYTLQLAFGANFGRTEWIEWGPLLFEKPGLVEKDILVADGLGAIVAGVVVDAATGQPIRRPPREPLGMIDFYVGLSNPEINDQGIAGVVDNETGTFCLRGLQPHLYTLHLIGPGLYSKILPAFADTRKKKIIDDIKLTVPPLGEIAFRLSGFADDELRRNLKVYFEMQWGPPLFPYIILLSSSQALAVPEGKGIATFKHDILGSVVRPFHIKRGETSEITLDRSDFATTEPAAAAVKIRLKNADGTPRAGMLLGFEKNMRYKPGFGGPAPGGVTDRAGCLSIDAIEPGIWSAWCANITPEKIALFKKRNILHQLEGELLVSTFHGLEIPSSLPPDFAIELVLPDGVIRGTLCHKGTGLPLSEQDLVMRSVMVNDPGQNYRIVGLSLATTDHRFELSAIPAGTYQLGVAAFGFGEYRSEIFTLAEREVLDMGKILLEPVGTAEIEVFDSAGNPLDARFDWKDKKGYASIFGLDSVELAKGRTAIGNLPLGPLAIEVRARHFKSETITLEIESHRRAKATVVLEPAD